jgi:hypothetical protein
LIASTCGGQPTLERSSGCGETTRHRLNFCLSLRDAGHDHATSFNDHVIACRQAGNYFFGVAFKYSAQDRIAPPHGKLPGTAGESKSIPRFPTSDWATENSLHLNNIFRAMRETDERRI